MISCFRTCLRSITIVWLASLLSSLGSINNHAQEVGATAADPRTVLTFGEKLKVRGVPNAGKVSDMLFRGAQPRGPGYEQLKALGISIVVDLRNTNAKSSERQVVESLGMRYISIPTSGYLGPTDREVATFLKVIRDNPSRRYSCTAISATIARAL
jgi:hypothetical protein